MLKIKGLRKSFGSVIAADDIDLSVAQGEALGSLARMAPARRRFST